MTAKNLLITGPPGIGKTTLIRKVVHGLGHCSPAGFYTAEIREAGIRKGFEIASLDGRRGLLSHIDIESRCRVGKYKVDIPGFERFIDSLDLMNPDHDPIVIDEIGKMECFSGKFRALVRDVLDSGKVVIATIAAKGGGFIAEIRSRPDVTIFFISQTNRDTLPGESLKLISSLLRPDRRS